MEDRKALRPARRTLRDESCPSEMYRRVKYNASPEIPIFGILTYTRVHPVSTVANRRGQYGNETGSSISFMT